ncbi:hypothetical protein AVEN_159884-1 [Araneus ventricosus]|uniref:Secreted protein n=1 Tax=Araneus ventricosus TaxID=182803 RepID=A0A4Y2E5Q5_ARAVE|nr:hypothetical protein AVEN_159884-1 [Araneus ventricosus]
MSAMLRVLLFSLTDVLNSKLLQVHYHPTTPRIGQHQTGLQDRNCHTWARTYSSSSSLPSPFLSSSSSTAAHGPRKKETLCVDG